MLFTPSYPSLGFLHLGGRCEESWTIIHLNMAIPAYLIWDILLPHTPKKTQHPGLHWQPHSFKKMCVTVVLQISYRNEKLSSSEVKWNEISHRIVFLYKDNCLGKCQKHSIMLLQIVSFSFFCFPTQKIWKGALFCYSFFSTSWNLLAFSLQHKYLL